MRDEGRGARDEGRGCPRAGCRAAFPGAFGPCVPLGFFFALGVMAMTAGCEAPRRLVSYPPGALPVTFERSTSYSTCLAASVIMAANYLEDSPRFKLKDVVAEIRRAYEWILANPDRRKTAKGMRRFLFNWLSRAVDSRSTSRAPPGPVLSDLERRNLEATKLWLAQKEQQHAN